MKNNEYRESKKQSFYDIKSPFAMIGTRLVTASCADFPLNIIDDRQVAMIYQKCTELRNVMLNWFELDKY